MITVCRLQTWLDSDLDQITLESCLNNLFFLPAVYHVGSNLGWSDIFFFTAMKPGQDWSVRLCVFGDMGNDNAQSLGRLQEETQRGHFDAILHVGKIIILCTKKKLFRNSAGCF